MASLGSAIKTRRSQHTNINKHKLLKLSQIPKMSFFDIIRNANKIVKICCTACHLEDRFDLHCCVQSIAFGQVIIFVTILDSMNKHTVLRQCKWYVYSTSHYNSEGALLNRRRLNCLNFLQ